MRDNVTIGKIKEGDLVILRTTWLSSRDKIVHKVKRITKSGKIRLENDLLFDREGRRNERGWGRMFLVPEDH